MALNGIILVDLDETLHKSARLKAYAWKHILSVLGFKWDEERNDGSELPGVAIDKRPQRGLAPHEFIRQLLTNLQLSVENVDESQLIQAGFQPEHITTLKELKEDSRSLQAQDTLISVLQEEWAASLTKAVKEQGVEAVDGAPEMVKRLHDEGYRIGIVTQAPGEYAQTVLERLGLINPSASCIDAVVDGAMVSKPKPDPEPLQLATWLILAREIRAYHETIGSPLTALEIAETVDKLLDQTGYKPIGLIGDSLSDVAAGRNFGIPVIILADEYTDCEKVKEAGAVLVTHPSEIHPEMFTNEVNRDFHPLVSRENGRF